MKHLFFYLFASLLLFAACKKYPEGGFFNRASKNIIGGWKLELYEVDGIDSTDLIIYTGNEQYKDVNIYEENTRYNPHLYIRSYGATENILVFKENKRKLEIYANTGYGGAKLCGGNPILCLKQFLNPETGQSTFWDIIKLSKTELIISSAQTKSYRIKLTKKR